MFVLVRGEARNKRLQRLLWKVLFENPAGETKLEVPVVAERFHAPPIVRNGRKMLVGIFRQDRQLHLTIGLVVDNGRIRSLRVLDQMQCRLRRACDGCVGKVPNDKKMCNAFGGLHRLPLLPCRRHVPIALAYPGERRLHAVGMAHPDDRALFVDDEGRGHAILSAWFEPVTRDPAS